MHQDSYQQVFRVINIFAVVTNITTLGKIFLQNDIWIIFVHPKQQI